MNPQYSTDVTLDEVGLLEKQALTAHWIWATFACSVNLAPYAMIKFKSYYPYIYYLRHDIVVHQAIMLLSCIYVCSLI